MDSKHIVAMIVVVDFVIDDVYVTVRLNNSGIAMYLENKHSESLQIPSIMIVAHSDLGSNTILLPPNNIAHDPYISSLMPRIVANVRNPPVGA